MSIAFVQNTGNRIRRKLRTKKNAFYYTASQYFLSVIGAIQGLSLAKILGPLLIGEVSAVNLVYNYGVNLQLGTLDAMNRNVPYYRSQGDFERAEKTKNSAFTFSLIISLFASIAVVPFAIFQDLSPFIRFGIIVYAFCVPTYFLFNFQLCLLRYHDDFVTIAKLQVCQGVFLAVIAITGAFFISNYAVVLGTFISFWGVNLIYFLLKQERFSLSIDKEVLREVLKLGLPLFSLGFVTTLLATIDRIFILMFMDHLQLGLYTFAVSMAAYYTMLGTAVNSVVYQKMISSYGKNRDFEVVNNTVEKSVLTIVLISPLMGFILEGVVRFLIEYQLPLYKPSKAILAIVIIPAFFKSASPFFSSGLITIGKHFVVLRNQIFLTIIVITLNIFFLKSLKMGIEGIAYATSISYVLFYIMQFFSFNHYQSDKLNSKNWQILLMFLLLCVVIAIRKISLTIAESTIMGAVSALFYVLISSAFYCLFLLIIHIHLRKRKISWI